MSFHPLIPLLAAISDVVLGLLVYSRRRGERIGRTFLWAALVLALWNLHFFVLYQVHDESLAFALARPARLGSCILPSALLQLILSLDESKPLPRLPLLLSYAVSLFLSVANLFDLVVADLRPFAWGYYSVGGRFYDLFTLSLIGHFIAIASILIYRLRTATDPRIRLQLRFWVLGAAVALPFGLTNLLPAYGIKFYPLGNFANAIWAGIVAYAIIRHRLLDVELFLSKGMAYVAVVFVLIAPAVGLILWLQYESFGQIHPDFSIAVALLFLGVAALFPSFQTRAQSRIERSLFRERHEYRSALSSFARSIVRILDRDRLLAELTSTLTQSLKLERLVVVLLEPRIRQLTVQAAVGGPPVPTTFATDHPLVGMLRERHRSVLHAELAGDRDAVVASISDLFEANGWEACIPLTAGPTIIGFIALGQKQNMEAFSSGDLDLLDTLGAEASVALENARLYEELKKSQEIIQRADRLSALGTLAAGIAHEVRNPLVSIQTFFQLAPDRRHDEEFFTSFLAMAADEVKRITHLINELLAFARSPARSPRPLDLNELIERVVSLLDPEARKYKVVIERALTPDTPLVHADEDQMKQILINLVLNGIQACKAGGTVSIRTARAERGGAPCARLEVADTGVGIASDQLDHIFVPFFTTKEKGTGLGLAIVHQLVSEHGGHIEVSSQEGVGATFSIDLASSTLGSPLFTPKESVEPHDARLAASSGKARGR